MPAAAKVKPRLTRTPQQGSPAQVPQIKAHYQKVCSRLHDAPVFIIDSGRNCLQDLKTRELADVLVSRILSAVPDGMAPLKIYWSGGSPFAWRLRACVEEKGVPYQAKLLDVSKSTHFPQHVILPMGTYSLKKERLMHCGANKAFCSAIIRGIASVIMWPGPHGRYYETWFDGRCLPCIWH